MAQAGSQEEDEKESSENDWKSVTLICSAALHLKVRQMFLFLNSCSILLVMMSDWRCHNVIIYHATAAS